MNHHLLLVIAVATATGMTACKKERQPPEAAAEPSNPAAKPAEPATNATREAAPSGEASAAANAAPVTKYAAIKCDVAGVKALRKRANARVKAGEPNEAVAMFAGSSCYFDESSPELASESAWMLSDYAFAHYKAGNFRSCHSLASSHLAPYPLNVAAVFTEDDKVIKALSYNADLCEGRAKKAFEGFETVSCALGVKGAEGVPKALLTPPMTDACLQILPGKQSEHDMYTAGDVIWITRAGGKTSKRNLTGDWVEDACNISSVGFAAKGSSLRILVSGSGRDCNGGTAASSFEEIYALEGTSLKQVDSYQIGYH